MHFPALPLRLLLLENPIAFVQMDWPGHNVDIIYSWHPLLHLLGLHPPFLVQLCRLVHNHIYQQLGWVYCLVVWHCPMDYFHQLGPPKFLGGE